MEVNLIRNFREGSSINHVRERGGEGVGKKTRNFTGGRGEYNEISRVSIYISLNARLLNKTAAREFDSPLLGNNA